MHPEHLSWNTRSGNIRAAGGRLKLQAELQTLKLENEARVLDNERRKLELAALVRGG